ncbi:MAG: hypothetical protein ACRDLP_05395 [Solirubrobacteraceae bacterium]
MRPGARRRRVLALQLVALLAVAGVAAYFSVITPAALPAPPWFVPSSLGFEPADAVVLAEESGPRAVAVAVRREGGRLELLATVIGASGAGEPGLAVSFEAVSAHGNRTVADAVASIPGAYDATMRSPAPLPRQIVVVLGRGGTAARVPFTLPGRWPVPAGGLVARAQAAYRGLHSLVTHERLASDLTHVAVTTYDAVAPDRLRFHVVGGDESIIIGSTRWDRAPGARWQRSPQAPIQSITPYWADPVEDAALLGHARVDGRATDVVSFADPQTPAFFTIWIDQLTHRTLRLKMTAAGHFMLHRYGPFNSNITVEPPR